MPATTARAVNLRIRDDIRNLIDRAAHAAGRSRSDFMIEASRRAAEDFLLDQRYFSLDEKQSEALARILDNPPPPNEALRRLMATKASWE
jgi:uncharacterized protein (DUF1778 family)